MQTVGALYKKYCMLLIKTGTPPTKAADRRARIQTCTEKNEIVGQNKVIQREIFLLELADQLF